jgi:AMMECR1 domain-containing protein
MTIPHHPIARLAWEAIRAYVEKGKVIEPPSELPSELADAGGVFVSIKKKGQLRGCIGTVEPQRATRAEEVIQHAIYAATRVRIRELPLSGQHVG